LNVEIDAIDSVIEIEIAIGIETAEEIETALASTVRIVAEARSLLMPNS
jgi:hypothetical protein